MPDDANGHSIEDRPPENIANADVIKTETPTDIRLGATKPPVSGRTDDADIQRLKSRMGRSEKWMVALTGAIALFALCSVIVGGLQWNVMSGQLGQMTKQLELTDRAWIKVIDVRAVGNDPSLPALSYQAIGGQGPSSQAFFNYEVHVKNVGRSAALNIEIVPELYLAHWDSQGYANEIATEEKHFCDSQRDRRPGREKGGAALFPEEPSTSRQGVGQPISADKINQIADDPSKIILPVLIGCIDYQFQSSTTIHQTRFIYELFHSDTRRRFFNIGDGVAADRLILVRNESDDYAD